MNFMVTIVSVALGVSAIVGASLLTPSIKEQRRDLQLTFTNELIDKETPAELRLAQSATGVFRGMAINFWWIRATQLKQEGRLYEAVNLAEKISLMQPRFPMVWEFNSWNMAYNLSVICKTPEERWYWVNKGLMLLRDKGIPWNPHSIQLYRQLGWIYQHKIGGYTDDMHEYYKFKIAQKWHYILQGPPPTEGTKEAYRAWLSKIKDAPQSVDELLAIHPDLKPIVDEATAVNKPLGQAFLFGADEREQPNEEIRRARQALLQRVVALPDNKRVALTRCSQAIALKELKLDVDVMIELGEKYAPIDWRHPAAHALYWMYMGIKKHDERNPRSQTDNARTAGLNTERGVLHALQLLAHDGKVIFQPNIARSRRLPDMRFIDEYIKAHEMLIERNPDRKKPFGPGLQNFLDLAVVRLYEAGYITKAREMYKKVQESYRKNENENDKYWKSIENFVRHDRGENMDPSNADKAIVQTWVNYYVTKYVDNDPDRAERLKEEVRQLWDQYLKKDFERPRTAAKRPRSFEQLKVDALAAYFLRPMLGMGDVAAPGMQYGLPQKTIWKATVYANITPQERADVYAVIEEPLRMECAQQRISFDRLFPKPDLKARSQNALFPKRDKNQPQIEIK